MSIAGMRLAKKSYFLTIIIFVVQIILYCQYKNYVNMEVRRLFEFIEYQKENDPL